MSFFRQLDLYKVIILLSVVLVPAALGFVYWVGGQIDIAEKALRAAERKDGELEKIGALQRQLESVEKNATNARSSGGLHTVFFEQQIDTASAGTLKKTDYEISPEVRRSAAQQKAQDQEVTISFRKDRNNPMNLPRDFIHAVIFNIESSGAQVWKLRQLKMRNAALTRNAKEAPPKTVEDLWDVQSLTFARREPEDR